MAQTTLYVSDREARMLIVGLELLRTTVDCACDHEDSQRDELLGEIAVLRDVIEIAEVIASVSEEACSTS
jgi:hypothetical protein